MKRSTAQSISSLRQLLSYLFQYLNKYSLRIYMTFESYTLWWPRYQR